MGGRQIQVIQEGKFNKNSFPNATKNIETQYQKSIDEVKTIKTIDLKPLIEKNKIKKHTSSQKIT